MTINKMLGRIFSRTVGIYYIIMAVFLILFFVYEMKQLYLKFQKGKRFTFYNTYVNEVYHFADKLELSQIKSSDQVKGLSKIFKITFKKNDTDDNDILKRITSQESQKN